MASDPLVAKLHDDFERLNKRVRENPHDPRILDVAVHEYRLIAGMALTELERLQNTIYTYYNDRT